MWGGDVEARLELAGATESGDSEHFLDKFREKGVRLDNVRGRIHQGRRNDREGVAHTTPQHPVGHCLGPFSLNEI